MHKRFIPRLASLGLGLCLFLYVFSVSGCGTALEFDDMSQQVLILTNEERAKEGLSPLTWNDKLAQAAANHCQDMIDRNYFDHYSPTGSTPGDRASAAGYSWQWVGENIAAGYNTPASVMTGWMNSPDHKENILLPQFTELGVGIRISPSGRYYWAQEFGTPF